MDTINSQLNVLFDKWKKRYIEEGVKLCEEGEPLFVCDGIMQKPGIEDASLDTKWKSSKRRIVLLLKDQHQRNGLWYEDIRGWFGNQKLLRKRFFKNIARLVYALNRVSYGKEVDFSDIKQEQIEEAINKIPFALVETKKLPGGSSITDSKLRKHIQKDKDFLKEELDILGANIIVCCGGPQHDFVVNEYFSKDHPWTFQSKNIHYDKGSNILVVYSDHPSPRKITDKDFFDRCLYQVGEFMKSHPEVLTNSEE